jgi:transposase
MDAGSDTLPDDIDALKAALVAERAQRIAAEALAAAAQAKVSDDQVLIAHLKLQIEKLRRTIFGQRSERSERLLDQLELQLEEAEASATADEVALETAAARTSFVAAFTRSRRASRSRRICLGSGWWCQG